jgi:S1-C subfamily serine protease
MVMSVEPEGPGARAGLLQGDVLLALDGAPVRHLDDLQSLLSAERAGKRVPLRIVRGGATTDLAIEIGRK